MRFSIICSRFADARLNPEIPVLRSAAEVGEDLALRTSGDVPGRCYLVLSHNQSRIVLIFAPSALIRIFFPTACASLQRTAVYNDLAYPTLPMSTRLN